MTPQKASETREWLLGQLENERTSFLNVVKAMPDNQLTYKPDDRVMDFGTLARHIAGSGAFFVTTIQNGVVNMEMDKPEESPLPATAAALAAEIENSMKSSMEAYRQCTPDQLAKQIDFAGMGAHPAVTFINWDLVHLIHHRAQLGMYLRLAGQKVPSMYGPTLDVSFEDMMATK